MKRILLLSLLLVILVHKSFATIWLVDNNPNSPQQFTTIQAAIDSAVAGDTIMVEGSAINYGSIIVSKPLVLIGEGYNDPLSENVLLIKIELWSSNCLVTGFYVEEVIFYGPSAINDSLYNILVERCQIRKSINLIGGVSDFLNLGNVVIRNNVINGTLVGGAYCRIGVYQNNLMTIDTFIFENNIADFFRFGVDNVVTIYGFSTILVRNNVFIAGVPNNGWPGTTIFLFTGPGAWMKDAIISNNIFYAADGSGCVDCTYFNNLTFGNGAADTLSIPQNNNIYSQDPLFVNYQGGAFSFNHDYNLLGGSLAINTGSDGMNIGTTGGTYPFKIGEGPKIPLIDYVNISNTAVPYGSTFYLQFDAKVRK